MSDEFFLAWCMADGVRLLHRFYREHRFSELPGWPSYREIGRLDEAHCALDEACNSDGFVQAASDDEWFVLEAAHDAGIQACYLRATTQLDEDAFNRELRWNLEQDAGPDGLRGPARCSDQANGDPP